MRGLKAALSGRPQLESRAQDPQAVQGQGLRPDRHAIQGIAEKAQVFLPEKPAGLLVLRKDQTVLHEFPPQPAQLLPLRRLPSPSCGPAVLCPFFLLLFPASETARALCRTGVSKGGIPVFRTRQDFSLESGSSRRSCQGFYGAGSSGPAGGLLHRVFSVTGGLFAKDRGKMPLSPDQVGPEADCPSKGISLTSLICSAGSGFGTGRMAFFSRALLRAVSCLVLLRAGPFTDPNPVRPLRTAPGKAPVPHPFFRIRIPGSDHLPGRQDTEVGMA